MCWASLALLALRAIAPLVPGRYFWGIDLARDLALPVALLGLALPLVLHAPAVGRAVARVLPAGAAVQGLLALALALFMFAHPDRALVTGDAGLRHGAFTLVTEPEKLASQAMRGDLLLHYDLPRWVSGHTPWNAEQTGRAQGALLALLSALAGFALARTLEASGEVAVAVATIAACTGALALDNGYGKASVEVACLAGIVAVGMLQSARTGGGVGLAGVCVALGLLLHRSALALVPAWIVAVVFAVRAGTWRRPANLVGALAPLAALVVVAPRLVHVLGTFDTEHHLAGGVGHTLIAAISPSHLVDIAHALCLLAPIVALLPVLCFMPPRPPLRESLALGALILPPLGLMLVVLPQQGLPRDWDVFAFGGVALAAAVAWRVAAVLGATPSARWLAVPLAASAAVPALQFAALQSDAPRMWARTESILIGPPARDASERARGLSTMGLMHYGLGQYAQALPLFERSADAAPNPRTYVDLGKTLTMLGRPAEAMARYRHAVTLNPDLVMGWRGVAAAASALGDRAAMLDAVHALERLDPDGDVLRDARAWLETNPSPGRP